MDFNFTLSIFRLKESLEEILKNQNKVNDELSEFRKELASVQRSLNSLESKNYGMDADIGAVAAHTWYPIFVALVMYSFLQWVLSWIFWI